MPRPHFLKRRYLINKPLQLKYAFMIGGVLAIMLILVQIHTYLTIQTLLPNLFSSFMGRQIRSIQFWLAVNSVIYLAVVAFLSIFISHKIAGPLYRLETAIQEVLESNDPAKRISLRKGDEFQTLADRLNQLLERLAQAKKS
jgi:methyl-accepting chemotaxis protein